MEGFWIYFIIINCWNGFWGDLIVYCEKEAKTKASSLFRISSLPCKKMLFFKQPCASANPGQAKPVQYE